jgi:hypothetical protein
MKYVFNEIKKAERLRGYAPFARSRNRTDCAVYYGQADRLRLSRLSVAHSPANLPAEGAPEPEPAQGEEPDANPDEH